MLFIAVVPVCSHPQGHLHQVHIQKAVAISNKNQVLLSKKKGGMITAYFKPKPKPAVPPPPKPRGRPRKQKTTASPEDQPPAKKAKEASADEEPPIQKRVDYSDPVIRAALDEAVDYYIATKKYPTAMEASLSHQPLMIFPKSTIYNHARMRNKEASMSPHQIVSIRGEIKCSIRMEA
jgi:hypothetical protein